MPLNFTAHWDDRTHDQDDTTGDIGSVAVIGDVWLAAQLSGHIPAPDYDPRPTSLATLTFHGYLDSDGRLKNVRGGTPGMRVWGNDPLFEMDRLIYRVSASLTDPLGRAVPFPPFYFDAPKEDRPVYLTLEMPKPGQKFGRGRPAFDIDDVTVTPDNDFTFVREDGFELPPVTTEVSDTVLPTATNHALVFAIALRRNHRRRP